jgi:hypothetical protein
VTLQEGLTNAQREAVEEKEKKRKESVQAEAKSRASGMGPCSFGDVLNQSKCIVVPIPGFPSLIPKARISV